MPAPSLSVPPDVYRAELGRDIVAAACLPGRFTLPSGHTRLYAFNPYMVATRPSILRRLAGAVADLVPPDADRLAGPAPGAVSLVTAVSLHLGLPCLFVEEQSRASGMVDVVDGEICDGERVVVLDLLPVDGREAVLAASALRQVGATVMAVVAALDLGDGAATAIPRAGFRFQSVFDAASLGLT
jgi:orotate phosphoribosyltransferase